MQQPRHRVGVVVKSMGGVPGNNRSVLPSNWDQHSDKDPKTLASDLQVFSLGEGLRQQTWTRCQENQGRAAVVAVALLLRESRGKAHRTLALIALH